MVHGHAFFCGGTPLPEVSGWDYAVPTMFEGVPAALRPPVALALAKAVESIPREDALPGGSVYELKFDGFRAVCLVGSDEVWLYSRQSKDLSRYFPEVLAAAAGQVPPGSVVDGELVVWSDDRLDFDALQLRMVTGQGGAAGTRAGASCIVRGLRCSGRGQAGYARLAVC